MSFFASKDLPTCFHDLSSGDIVVGEIASAHHHAAQLIDLLQRGVTCIPSALAQLLSRSKMAQVEVLGRYMLPHTMAVKRRKDLLDAINVYNRAGIGAVVTKEEHMHCGHGVRRWDHIETVYSFRGLEKEHYPFVLQPLVGRFTDVRVIMVGDYVEAYSRSNPHNFRGNLSAGGAYEAYPLTVEQERFCRQIVARGGFPYAHVDLQVLPGGRLYLLEIALNGGIRGSRLDRRDLDERKTARLRQLTQTFARTLPKPKAADIDSAGGIH